MKIKITFNHEYTPGEKWGVVKVIKEDSDKKYYKESELFYHIKKELNRLGLDLVKKTTESDGHMFGDKYTYYLRDKKWRFCIVDNNYMIDRCYHDFNAGSKFFTLIIWEPEKVVGLFNKRNLNNE